MVGKFIVFEGGEGGGKTTQIARSQQWLAASDWCAQAAILVTRQPGGTALGQHIRHWLLHPDHPDPIQAQTELLLYAADRAHHVTTVLQPHLAAGGLVLCDRYTDSTLAYQGYGRQLSLALIDQLNAIATAGLQSDLTLWLDVPVEQGLQRTQQRGQADRMEQSTRAFHERVRAGFQALAQQYPDRIQRIDASLDADQVFAQIQAVLTSRFAQWSLLPSPP